MFFNYLFLFTYNNTVLAASVANCKEFDQLLNWLYNLGVLKGSEFALLASEDNSQKLSGHLLDLSLHLRDAGYENALYKAGSGAPSLYNALNKFRRLEFEGDWHTLEQFAKAKWEDYRNQTSFDLFDGQDYYSWRTYERVKSLEDENPWLRS